jgi:putative oxidoreductase
LSGVLAHGLLSPRSRLAEAAPISRRARISRPRRVHGPTARSQPPLARTRGPWRSACPARVRGGRPGHDAQRARGYGIAGTGQFLEQLGFRPGRLHAARAGLAEALGGLFLAGGFLTPAAAAAVVAVMVVAAVSVHIEKGFFAPNGGYEYNLVLAAAALALAFTGPGVISLDQALGMPWSGDGWGVAALAAGLIGAAVPLIARRTGRASVVPNAA